MEIIAHRGYWINFKERNTMEAMRRAALNEMGTETDFRDLNGMLKVSHNMAEVESPDAEEFFSLYRGTKHTLALNIKADGIQVPLKQLVDKYNIDNYFCFDMSIPDTLGYIENKLNFFTRESEYEPISAFYELASGVWLDGFISDDWITEEKISKYLSDGKRVCIVSPDLHAREYENKWREYKNMDVIQSNQVILCTDYPQEARRFFNE